MITDGSPLSADVMADALQRFHRDGYALVCGVLQPAEITRLRELTDQFLDQLEPGQVDVVYSAQVLRNTQSLDVDFCRMLGREPFLSISEAILGPGFGFCGQNVIRSAGGEAISRWHVDDILEWPLPAEIPRHDARLQMPVQWFSFQIALSDITTADDGPTEVVAGSHYSGRVPPRNREEPDELQPPTFEGRAPTPVLCRAGDIYIFNHQLWHRGRPNASGRRRYLMQNQYGRAWITRRFSSGPHRTCSLADAAISDLSPRTRELLGR